MMNGMVLILFILIFVVIMLAVGILQLIATWKVYKKAGERGWAAIVPFYNLYVMVKITWGNGWLFLLYLVPLGNVVFGIATYIKLARVFGKGGGYAAGLVFFPYVFLSILGFGKAWYQGPDTKKSRGVIIATAVVGGLYVLLMVLVGTLGFAVGLMDGLQDGGGNYADVYEDQVYGEPEDNSDLDLEEYNDTYDTENDSVQESLEDEYVPMEGYDYFVKTQLEYDGSIVEVPILKSENMVVSGSSAVSVQDGVMTTLQLSYAYDEDPAAVVSEMAEMRKESLESMPDYYSNVTSEELITGDGFALQQINYDAVSFDGEAYPSFEIIKCDLVDGNYVVIMLTVDNTSAAENTKSMAEEAFEAYGIEFEFDE